MTHSKPTKITIDRKKGSITLPLAAMQAHVLEVARLHRDCDRLWQELVTLAGKMPVQ